MNEHSGKNSKSIGNGAKSFIDIMRIKSECAYYIKDVYYSIFWCSI